MAESNVQRMRDLTIPKNVVESLGWKKGDRLRIDTVTDMIEIMKKPEILA